MKVVLMAAVLMSVIACGNGGRVEGASLMFDASLSTSDYRDYFIIVGGDNAETSFGNRIGRVDLTIVGNGWRFDGFDRGIGGPQPCLPQPDAVSEPVPIHHGQTMTLVNCHTGEPTQAVLSWNGKTYHTEQLPR